MRLRTALLLALVAAVALFAFQRWQGTGPERFGMLEQHCGADGKPVTGQGEDDWAERCIFSEDNARILASGERPEVVMIGDSLTYEWPDPGKGIVKRGIGGQTSPQVVLRFQQDVVALKPQIVHILVGTNDIAGNTGASAPQQYLDNIRAMIAMAQANGIAVVIGTIPPLEGLESRPTIETRPWPERLNRELRKLADQRGIVIADYHAALANPDGSRRDDLFRDELHFSAAGYERIDEVFRAALDRARKASGPVSPASAGAAPAGGDS
jgi:lysophospholipase L1-like esterase